MTIRAMLVAGAMAIGLAQPAEATVTFNFAYLEARLDHGAGNDGDNDYPNELVYSPPAAPLTVSANGKTANASGEAIGTATANAAFNNASGGKFTTSLKGDVMSIGTGEAFVQAQSVLEYQFISDTPFYLAATYDVTNTSTEPPLPTLLVAVRNVANSTMMYRQRALQTSGSLISGILDPGTYLLTIGNDRILGIGASGGMPASESLDGTVTFQITAVPEPATWATMLLGFGLMGVGARRRLARV